MYILTRSGIIKEQKFPKFPQREENNYENRLLAAPSQGYYETDDRGKKQRNANEINGLEHLSDAVFSE